MAADSDRQGLGRARWDWAGAFHAAKMLTFFSMLFDLSGGFMVPVHGGVLIRDASKVLLVAAGVSGDTPENDEICAVEAVRTAKLVAYMGEAGLDGSAHFVGVAVPIRVCQFPQFAGPVTIDHFSGRRRRCA